MATNGTHYDHSAQVSAVTLRCSDCGRVHTDERFSVCRECGAQL